MIKDELLHTHQLLDELVTHFEEERDVPVEIDEYEDAETGPMEVFKNKSKHEAAVKALGSDLGAAAAAAEPAGEEDEVPEVAN